MKEISDIIKAYDNAVNNGKQTVLATVVKAEGSLYGMLKMLLQLSFLFGKIDIDTEQDHAQLMKETID